MTGVRWRVVCGGHLCDSSIQSQALLDVDLDKVTQLARLALTAVTVVLAAKDIAATHARHQLSVASQRCHLPVECQNPGHLHGLKVISRSTRSVD